MLDVAVAGLVFFEVFVPADADWPPPGEEAFVPRLPVGLGGALNTASVARALGATVALISPRGRGLCDHAIAARVAALGVVDRPWSGPDDAALTLVRSTPRDRAFLSAVAPGALEGCPPLPAARRVHVGGLAEAERLAARLAEARAGGARVSVSAGWDVPRLDALSRARTPPWDLFFANAREAALLTGDAETVEPARAAARLAERLACDVVVSDGPRGAHAVFAGRALFEAAHAVDVLDPTGAGDALAGGVLAALARGWPPARALALGARAAERALTVRGGVVEAALLRDLVTAGETA